MFRCYMTGVILDLPKLMPEKYISLMPSSYLSFTDTRQDTRQ